MYIKCVNEHHQGIAGVDGLRGDDRYVQCDQQAVGIFVTEGFWDAENGDDPTQEFMPHCTDCGPEMMHELKQMGHEYIITADLTEVKEHTS